MIATTLLAKEKPRKRSPALARCLTLERMQRVAQDFAQQHQADQRLPSTEVEGYTLLLAMRSWEFEAFTRLRR